MSSIATILAATLFMLFHLETADLKEKCDFDAEMSEALERLAKGFEAVSGDEPAPVTFVLRVTSGTRRSTVHVELLRPDGSVALSRRLSYKPSACGPLADAVSLIIERYLEDIGWRSSGAGLLPPRNGPVESPSKEQTRPEETAAQPDRWQIGASIDVHGSLDSDVHGWFGPELGAYGRFKRLDLGVYLGGNFWRRNVVEYEGARQGTVTLFSSYGLMAVGLCWSGHGRFCARGAIGLEQVFGHSDGELIKGAGWEVVWQMFVRGQLLYVFTDHGRIRPYAALAADFRPHRGGFEVEQADRRFRTALLAGTLSLGFRWHIFKAK